MSDDRMTAAQAALKLGLSYQATRQLIMERKLDGGADQIPNSNHLHWWANRASVERYEQTMGG